MARLVSLTLSLLLALGCLASSKVPKRSTVLQGIDEQTMRERLAHTDLQPLEGVWQYPAEDMTVAIERYNGENNVQYRVIMLGSRDIGVLPGTVIGYIAPSATHDKYTLWLYCERDDSTLQHPVECVATLNSAASSLTFDQTQWRVRFRVNLARFLPSLFKGVSIIPRKEKETIPLGFNKVFPADNNGELNDKVIYL